MRGDGVRVLVVGAGIAGLAAARTLRAWGATVDVVERAAGPEADGFGIYLPGNAVRALAALGLDAAAAEQGVRIERQRFSDHRGRVLVEVDVAALWRDVGPCLALHRADLRRVLLDGVRVRWRTSVRAITPTADGVQVALTDGDTLVGSADGDTLVGSADGDTLVGSADGDTFGYDLVLGADGVHSTVRRLIFDGAAARPVGQYARRFLALWPDPTPMWWVMLGPGSTFLSIPIGGGFAYCYSDTPLGRRHAPLREVLADFAEPVPSLLAAADETPYGSVVEEVALPSWSRGPVLLIGDAAHATSPNMAEGAAMAVEDAIALASSLATSDTIAQALAAYENRRRPRTDWVAAQTHRRDRMRGLPPPVRNLVLRRFGQHIFRSNYRPLHEPP